MAEKDYVDMTGFKSPATSPAGLENLVGGAQDMKDFSSMDLSKYMQNPFGELGLVEGMDLTSKDYGIDLNMPDWGMKGLGGTALGAGQLGLGVMGYLEDKKTAKLQRELMGQQVASNATTAQNRALDRASLKQAFAPNQATAANPYTSTGL